MKCFLYNVLSPKLGNDLGSGLPSLAPPGLSPVCARLDLIQEWLRWEGASGVHLVQPPLLKHGHLEQAAQDHVQLAFDCLQGWRLHNFSGSLSQCLVALTAKKCFLMFEQNLLCFSLCPSPPVLSLGTTEKRLAPPPLRLPFRYLHTLIPLSFLFSRLGSPSSLSLPS